MRRIALRIAWFACLLGAFLAIVQLLFESEHPVPGIMLVLAIPILVALAVVFDFVANKLREEELEREKQRPRNYGPGRKSSGGSDVRGTPWDSDPGHTS